jgi:iron transport multicopper oxidase
MTIIEVDGVYTEPAETDMIYLTAAQRYGVLVTTRNETSSNFAMVGSMDTVSLVMSSQKNIAEHPIGSF